MVGFLHLPEGVLESFNQRFATKPRPARWLLVAVAAIVLAGVSAAQSLTTPVGTINEPVGTKSSAQTATVMITTAGALSNIVVLTEGVSNKDFQLSSSSCSLSAPVTVGQVCTIGYTFQPQVAGLRRGGISLNDSGGNPLGVAYIAGYGTGPQLATYAGSKGFASPQLVIPGNILGQFAVDGAGNIFYANPALNNPAVMKATLNPDGSYTSMEVGGQLNLGVNSLLYTGLHGIALDGLGNIFYNNTYSDPVEQDHACSIGKFTPVNGGYTQSDLLKYPGQHNCPVLFAVDGAGTIYYYDDGTVGMGSAKFAAGAYTNSLVGGSGDANRNATDMAVDPEHNIYFVDCYGDTIPYTYDVQIFDLNPSTGAYGQIQGPWTPNSNNVPNYFGYQCGVAPDNTGGFWMSDATNTVIGSVLGSAIFHFTPNNGTFNYAIQEFTAPFNGIIGPIRIDSQGNIYFNNLEGGGIYKITALPLVTYPTTTSGSVSAAQDLIFTNTGTSSLSLESASIPSFVTNVSANGINGYSNCSAGTTSLLSGGMCDYSTEFAPSLALNGLQSGTMNFGTNAYTPQYSIAVQGTANHPLPSVTSISPSTGASVGGTIVTLNGTGLDNISAARFNATPATLIMQVSTTQVELVAPAGASGTTATITVTNPAGSGSSASGAWAWNPPPSAATSTFSLSSNAIPETGTTTITATIVSSSGVGIPNELVKFQSSNTSAAASIQAMTNASGVATATITGLVTGSTTFTATVDGASIPGLQVLTVTGLVPVGSTVTGQTGQVTVTKPGTLSSIVILNKGMNNGDWTITSSNCNSGAPLSLSQICNIVFSFTPSAPGLRQGAIELLTSTGSVLGETFISDVGLGTQGLFSNGTQVTIHGQSSTWGSAAVDDSGNIYGTQQDLFQGQAGEMVSKITPTGAISTIAIDTGDDLAGIAVDGAGNVFYGDANTNEIYELAEGVGTPVGIASVTNPGTGMATDNAGNIYVGAALKVIKIDAITHATSQVGSVTGAVGGVGLDISGDIFYTDSTNSKIYETLAGGTTGSVVSSGVVHPAGITVDPAGNLYVVAPSAGTVYRLAAGTYAVSTVYNDPGNEYTSVVLDRFGNLYVAAPAAQSGQVTGNIFKITRNTASVTFPTTVANSTSATSLVPFENDGNGAMTVSTYSTTSQFGLASTTNACAIGTLAVGGSCEMGLSFEPTTSGSLTGSATLTESSGATYTVALSGSATKASQTITFPAIPSSATSGTQVTLTATASSGLAVTYSVTGPATVTGSTLSYTGAGTVVITASQAGNATYAAAVIAQQTITVQTLTQTITFPAIPSSATSGTQVTLAATASSGLAVTYSVTGPATVTGSTLSYTGAGTVVITASQAGNVTYTPAVAVQQTITVQTLAQTITFPAIPSSATSGTQVTLTATASSGLAVTYSVTGPATLAGSVLTYTGAGTVVITASQAGNITYAAATAMQQTVTVQTLSQTITFPPIPSSATSGTQVTLTATASSGLVVTYSVTGPATLIGSVLIYTGAGTVVITANQAGNITYAAAPSVQMSVLVTEKMGNTGAPGVAYTAAVTFAKPGTLEQINVLTQGLPNLDFQLATGGTCAMGTAYIAGQSCSVNYIFAPSAPGARLGAIVSKDGAGNLLGTTYLGGIGNGPQALFTNGISANVASALNNVRGVSVDAAGNVYASEQSANTVDKFAAGTGAKTVLATASGSTTGTAVDGAGNVYFGAGNTNAIYELVGGTGTPVEIASGWSSDNVLLADAAGNLYSPDGGTGAIYKIAAGTHTVATVLAGGQNHRFIGMAIDAGGNLYAADFNSSTMYEVVAGSGTATELFSGNGLSSPHGAAIDPAGNLYVTNYAGDGNVERYAAGTYAQTELPTGYASVGIAIDSSGNLLTLDGSNIKRYTRTAAPALSFSWTDVGATTAAQVTSIENDGNAPLTISALATSSASFTVNPATTTCSTTVALAAAETCNVGVTFTPQIVGSLTGAFNITDNSLNVTGSLQQVALAGTATTAQPIVSVTNTSISHGVSPATLTAVVTYGGVQPTGAVTFQVDNGASFTASCTVGSGSETCSASYNSSALAIGSHPIAAVILGDTNYDPAEGTGTLTVNDTLASFTVTGIPIVASPGTPYTATVTAIGASGATFSAFNGTVTLSSTDSLATFSPTSYTYQPADNGTHTFTVTFGTAGTQTVTATSGSATGSEPGIVVNDVIWVVNGNGSVSELSESGTPLLSAIGTTTTTSTIGGMAIDSSGGVWSVTSTSNTLNYVSKSGTGATSYTGGGLNAPTSVAVDGNGQIWVTNGNGTVSEFSSNGTAISPSTGYMGGNISSPGGIAIDTAGNVWVSNGGNNTVTEVLGGAAPAAPLSLSH